MSNQIVFARFGMGPDPRVSEVLMSEIIANKTEAKILPLPGIIISVFKSELTPTQIRDRFKNDSELNEVPFMVSNGILSGDSVFFIGRKGKKKQILKVTL